MTGLAELTSWAEVEAVALLKTEFSIELTAEVDGLLADSKKVEVASVKVVPDGVGIAEAESEGVT